MLASHLHSEHIIVAHALQDLGHVVQAHAHAQVAVASEVVEAVRAELQVAEHMLDELEPPCTLVTKHTLHAGRTPPTVRKT